MSTYYTREEFQALVKKNCDKDCVTKKKGTATKRSEEICRSICPTLDPKSKDVRQAFRTVAAFLKSDELQCKLPDVFDKSTNQMPLLDGHVEDQTACGADSSLNMSYEGDASLNMSCEADSSLNMSYDDSMCNMNMSFEGVPVEQNAINGSFNISVSSETTEVEELTIKLHDVTEQLVAEQNKNVSLTDKLKQSRLTISDLRQSLASAEESLLDQMNDVACDPQLEREKGKYINPRTVLILMRLLARGMSQVHAIECIKDVNSVVNFMPAKDLERALPARGGSTSKVVAALGYVIATTNHERMLKFSSFTTMADDTTLGGKKVLAVAFQDNSTGENLVAKCGQIADGKGTSIARGMMSALENIRDAGNTDKVVFMEKVCRTMTALQSDGGSAQDKGNNDFRADVTNMYKHTYQLVHGKDLTDEEMHKFDREIIYVYCGLHCVKHCEDVIRSCLNQITLEAVSRVVAIIGVGRNREHNPLSLLGQWQLWIKTNIPITARFTTVVDGVGMDKVAIFGNTHHRIGTSGVTWRALFIQYPYIIQFLKEVHPLKHKKLITFLEVNKDQITPGLYAASTMTGNLVCPLWRVINNQSIGMQEFLSILRLTIELLEKMKIEAALYELQSVGNPLYPFIPHRGSRDEAERQYNSLLVEEDPANRRVYQNVSDSLKAMAGAVSDLLTAKYSNLLETDNVTAVHDKVPRSNGRCESILATAGSFCNRKSRQLAENREVLVLANLNKTMEYLAKRPLSWQLNIVKDAWQKAPGISASQVIVNEQHQAHLRNNLQEIISTNQKRDEHLQTDTICLLTNEKFLTLKFEDYDTKYRAFKVHRDLKGNHNMRYLAAMMKILEDRSLGNVDPVLFTSPYDSSNKNAKHNLKVILEQ